MNKHFLFGSASRSVLQTFSKITSIVLAFLFFITPLAPAFAQEVTPTPTGESTTPASGDTSIQNQGTETTPPADQRQPATQPETPDAHGKKSDATTPDTAPTDTKKGDKQKEPKKITEPPTEPVVNALTDDEDDPDFMISKSRPHADGTMGALVYDVPIDVPPGLRLRP